MRPSACRQGAHRVGGRLRPGVWCRGAGRRDTGHPGGPGVSPRLAVRCPGARAVGPQGRRPVGGLERPHGRGDDRPNVTASTGSAPEGRHHHGNPRVVGHHHVQPHVVQVRPRIAAVAARAMQDRCVRRPAPVVAPIDVEPGAIKMGHGRRQPEALHGRDCQATVERCHARRLARVHGASQRLIRERLSGDPGGDEARCGGVLTAHRHTRAWWVPNAQPLEDHRVDGMAPGDTPGLWGVRRRAVEPSAQAAMVQDCRPVHSGPRALLSSGDAPDLPACLK